MLVEQGYEHIAEVAAPSHPLQIMPSIVVIRAVDLSTRKCPIDPIEERCVLDVHSQSDLWLTAVSPEVTFSDQQPDQDTFFELCRQSPLLRVVVPSHGCG